MSLIGNAKDTPLNANSGTLPDVSGAMLDYFQPLSLGVVTKTNVAGRLVETQTVVTTGGVWQPFSERDLMIKPEGERSWNWFWLHTLPALVLQTDSVVTYLGEQYRVKARKDYKLYGYVEYQLVEDWTGSGPEVAS